MKILILLAVLLVLTTIFPNLESWLNAIAAVYILGKILMINDSMKRHNNKGAY